MRVQRESGESVMRVWQESGKNSANVWLEPGIYKRLKKDLANIKHFSGLVFNKHFLFNSKQNTYNWQNGRWYKKKSLMLI